jgi:hypothetical protein
MQEPKDVKDVAEALKYSDSVQQEALKHALFHWIDLTNAENELTEFHANSLSCRLFS